MRNTLITLAVAGLTLVATEGAARATPQYSAVYAFGDSLSDAGNIFIATGTPGSPIPHQPLAPYSQGRRTNGNIWVQDLSLMLGNGPLTPSLGGGNDFAYAGARTGSIVATPTNPYAYTQRSIDLPSQLLQFDAVHGSAPSSALYTLSTGTDNVLATIGAVLSGTITPTQATEVVSQAAQNAANFAKALHAEGATRLLLLNAPNLGLTPPFSATNPLATTIAAAFNADLVAAGFSVPGVTLPFSAAGPLATTLAAAFNADLAADLAPVEASGLTVTTLDSFSLLDDAIANPAKFGFSNVTDPCWTGSFIDPNSGTLCSPTASGQDQYLFWDSVGHPTEAGHQRIADQALADLPEPSGLAAVAGGMLVLGLAVRRGLRGEAPTRR
jgi:phospholipase/lecithinase/hemolysin